MLRVLTHELSVFGTTPYMSMDLEVKKGPVSCSTSCTRSNQPNGQPIGQCPRHHTVTHNNGLLREAKHATDHNMT